MKKYEKLLNVQKINRKISLVYESLLVTFSLILTTLLLVLIINMNKHTVPLEKYLGSYYEMIDMYYFKDANSTYKNSNHPEVYFLTVIMIAELPLMIIILITQIITSIHKKVNKKYFAYKKEFVDKYLEFKKNGSKNEVNKSLKDIMMNPLYDKYEQMNMVYAILDDSLISKKKEFESYITFGKEWDIDV